jgi:putative heme iron utilization protein
MHTILKSELKQSDFARIIPEDILNYLNSAIKAWNNASTTLEKDDMFMYIINNLPSGYIQKSHITCSYENLLTMYSLIQIYI